MFSDRPGMIETDIATAGTIDLIFGCASQTLDSKTCLNEIGMSENNHDGVKEKAEDSVLLIRC